MRLTEIFTLSSSFFWYPPKEVLSQKNVADKLNKQAMNVYPGNGFSFLKPSVQIKQQKTRRMFNNDFSSHNQFKASWKSMK